MKALLAGAMAAFGLATTASAADVSGAWTVKADVGGLRYALVCVMTADTRGFGGPCIATQGKLLPTHGRRNGDRLTFSYPTDYNGSGITVAYDGVVQSDHAVTGAVTANGAKGVFQGERLAASETDRTETWNLGVAFPGEIRYPVICTFKGDPGRLSGPCALTTGPTLHVSGAADGSNVTFAYDTEAQGHPVHVVYTGLLQPDGAVRGTVKAGDATGAFSASKP